MNCVVLGLGSNKSYNGFSSIELLAKAVMELKKIMQNVKCSSVYCTKPMYVEDQDVFYNMVIVGSLKDKLEPHELLQKIHLIEASLGRDRTKEVRFGPRSIDIDIEFFDNIEMRTPDLEIPHPRVAERAFVLQPLLEILSQNADILQVEKLLKIQLEYKDLKSRDVELFMKKEDFLCQVE